MGVGVVVGRADGSVVGKLEGRAVGKGGSGSGVTSRCGSG